MELLLDGNDWRVVHLIPTEWVLRKVWEENYDPMEHWSPAGNWLQATVPGDVISDAVDAGLIPEPYKDVNSRSCEWLSERDWVYQKQFTIPIDWKTKIIRLRFDGVDYACSVYLNGKKLGKHEGMFTPFEFDITRRVHFAQPNNLIVVVEHKPPVDLVQGQFGWTNRARLWKSRFAYDWDWCTRLVPIGIWQSVRLFATDEVWLDDVWVRPHVQQQKAQIEIRSYLRANPVRNIISNGTKITEVKKWKIRGTIFSPQGKELIVVEKTVNPVRNKISNGVNVKNKKIETGFKVTLDHLQLWEPNGSGEQPLYQVQIELSNPAGRISDSRTRIFGLRTVRMIKNVNSAKDALPYTLEVNEKKVFVNGWNWVPIDNLYGRVQSIRYERLLTLAKHANCNLLRVWGGGLLEREEFYNLCDKFGILVWQEFPLSSSGIQNTPPQDAKYLKYIESHARQMIPLKRNHSSLVIWCGGNELTDEKNVPLTDNHPALKVLKSVVKELDPDRNWLPTSPSGPVFNADPKLAGTNQLHDVHGPWMYLGPQEQYYFYNSIDPLYHSEFGVEGATNLGTLRRFVSPKFEFPPDKTNPVWVHHGDWWLNREKIERLFGEIKNLETFIRASQWLQAEGLRYAVESSRRRQWHCSGVSPWQFNEAFPNTSCSNAVDYLGFPKPAYWWVKRAYAPVHISLKYSKLVWEPGEEWNAEVWVHNSLSTIPGCQWETQLLKLSGKIIAASNGAINIPENNSIKIAEIKQILPDISGGYILFLRLFNVRGIELARNEYFFSTVLQNPFQPLLSIPQTQLSIVREKNNFIIENIGSFPALFIQITPDNGKWILPEDDYFCLAPGEKRKNRIDRQFKISVRAWNSQNKIIVLN
jgi:beta-mannosidase